MAASHSGKGGKKNFMWSALKHEFLVAHLAERAKNGEKKGKSFNRETYKKAADAVAATFHDNCKPENIESWMKTAKKQFAKIMQLREISGWAWDDDLKIIKVDRVEAAKYIEVDSSAKELLNVPLGDFDDLRVICGEDQATGSYGKSFADIPSESINVDDTSETQGMSAEPQSNKRRVKRSRPWEEAFSMIGVLTEQVTRMTEAIVSSDQHADQNFCDRVYAELLGFEDKGFDDDFLTKAFEYLTSHSLTGRQFLAKRHIAQLKWLKDFASRII